MLRPLALVLLATYVATVAALCGVVPQAGMVVCFGANGHVALGAHADHCPCDDHGPDGHSHEHGPCSDLGIDLPTVANDLASPQPAGDGSPGELSLVPTPAIELPRLALRAREALPPIPPNRVDPGPLRDLRTVRLRS